MTTIKTLAERFAEEPSGRLEFEGRELRREYWISVERGSILEISFLLATASPVQGLGMFAEHCELTVADTTARNIVLWADSAPRFVTTSVKKRRAGARVRFINQWRDEKYKTTMYHLNNAAMEVIEHSDGSVRLNCSDGCGGPDFDDLVVEIRRPPD